MTALAKIHIAKKELALHDDDYRAILERITGQRSAKGLSDAQAGAVLDEFKRRGWKPAVVKASDNPKLVVDNKTAGASQPKSKPADHATARKARAMWISLWQLGAVRDRSESALESFARRQGMGDRLVWADRGQMHRLIEALKAMATRAGWSQDAGGATGVHELKALKRNLISAQLAKLEMTAPAKLEFATLEELTDLAAKLGARIRERA